MCIFRILVITYFVLLAIVGVVVIIILIINISALKAILLVGTVYCIVNIIGLLAFGIHIFLVLTAVPQDPNQKTSKIAQLFKFKVIGIQNDVLIFVVYAIHVCNGDWFDFDMFFVSHNFNTWNGK